MIKNSNNDELEMPTEVKGVVACPSCKKEFVFAYTDAKGHALVPCVRCGRIILVNYENLTATIITPTKRKNK